MIHDNFGPEDERGFTWVDDFENRNEIIDRIRAFDRANARGAYPEPIDEHAAYWIAEGVTPPGERQSTSIYRFGLRALEHDVLTAEEFRDLWQQLERWRLSDDAMLVLSLCPNPRDRDAPRWTSAHPIVLALRTGMIDGALTSDSLAQGTVTLALTLRTIVYFMNHPNAVSRMHCAWSVVRLAGGEVIGLEYEASVTNSQDILQDTPDIVDNFRATMQDVQNEEEIESERLEADLKRHLDLEMIRQQIKLHK